MQHKGEKKVVYLHKIENQTAVMTPFLQQIAQRYYADYGDRLRSVVFVFPNRRAGLFFRQALARVAQQPLFAPDIFAINDLFFRASNLLQADRVTLQFALFNAYRQVTGSEEPFDRFCSFGEMLLADFDDIDKYMADAEQIFRNIGDLKELESDFSWLGDEKLAIVAQFWKVFLPNKTDNSSDKNGDFKQQFSEIWAKLFELYTIFKADLRQRGIGYDGMIFRDVIDADSDLKLDYERVVFVGFNALTKSEAALLEKCQKRGIGDFYFDYQSPEIAANGNIAAQFVAENRRFRARYTLDAPEKPTDRQIELIAIPSDIGQTKQVYRILTELQAENPDNANLRTVVVLPNEQLLIPQLHAIPASVAAVNVTMGYPLSLTPVAALVEHIAAAQRNSRTINGTLHFYYKHVLAVLNHQLIAERETEAVNALVERIRKENLFLVSVDEFKNCDLLAAIFRSVETTADFVAYFADVIDRLAQLSDADRIETEFFVRYKAAINRVAANLRTFSMDIEKDTFFRLLSQLTASQTVSFKGEPVEGLQLMGTLETRALDFENVVIAAFNEGIFPRKNSAPSIIPYNLRRAFGLPTHEYHDAIFAYNFYRLIYRARRVFLIYDSRTDGQHGELSRYAAQLEYLYNLPLRKKSVGYEVMADAKGDAKVAKEGVVAERLRAFCTENSEKYISASDINAYIDCPMRFYYSKIEGLTTADDVSETVEANTFGSIFHRVMELLYKPYVGKMLTKEALDTLVKSQHQIDEYLSQAFAEVFYKGKKMPLLGQNLLIAHIIRTYVQKTLAFDRDVRAPFRYCCSEERMKTTLTLDNGLKINVKGIIDRVDEKEGFAHIVDYKTGHVEKNFKAMASLFDSKNKERPKAVLQTFFYALLYHEKHPSATLKPIIYELRNLADYEISCGEKKSAVAVSDFGGYKADFRQALNDCLTEIFNPEQPFFCTDDTERCKYCNFKQICNR